MRMNQWSMYIATYVSVYIYIYIKKEFCVGGSKQKTVLYSSYRTAKVSTVLYWVVIEPEIDKQFYIE